MRTSWSITSSRTPGLVAPTGFLDGILAYRNEPPARWAIAAAALVDRPHHQALAAPHVAGREHPRHARREPAVLRLRVRPRVLLHPELVQQLVLRAAEAQRQQHQLGRECLLAARDVPRERPA